LERTNADLPGKKRNCVVKLKDFSWFYDCRKKGLRRNKGKKKWRSPEGLGKEGGEEKIRETPSSGTRGALFQRRMAKRGLKRGH